MKRGQVFVRARDGAGRWGAADVLDLDDDSFRAFIIDILFRAGAVCGVQEQYLPGDPVAMRTRPEVRFKTEAD